MTMENIFGKSEGLIGTLEKSEVVATIGKITAEGVSEIGLTNIQIENIGARYGNCFIKLYEETLTPVEVYLANIVNPNCPNKIWITKKLSEKTELSIGDEVILTRNLDDSGRIKYFCERDYDNPFGKSWEKLPLPIEAIIAAIDSDGYNSELYRIGLSAMQITNLDLLMMQPEKIIDESKLITLMEKCKRGLLDGNEYEGLIIEYENRQIRAKPYNAHGLKKGINGCGVRISSILAEELNLSLGDRVKLYTT